jgi:hypothetical protein
MNMKFDFENMSLGGFSVGESVSTDSMPIADKERGYSINIEDGKVIHISVYLANPSYGFQAYTGDIQKGTEQYSINAFSSCEDIKNIFGEPSDGWNDGVEENLEFVVDQYTVEFSWNIDSDSPKLMYFCIGLV